MLVIGVNNHTNIANYAAIGGVTNIARLQKSQTAYLHDIAAVYQIEKISI